MRRRFAWPDFPILLAAAVWFTGGALLVINLVLGAVAHGRQMKLCAALYGVAQPVPVIFSWPDLLDGDFQRSFAFGVGKQEPFFPVAVRLRNQLEYSLFNVAASANVIVGLHRQLLQKVYITDYCTRSLTAFLPTAPDWAKKIRAMQDNAQARGQTFLYVITPSKVAQYPQYLPPGLSCPSAQADRTGIVPAWVALVHAAGVRMVDTTAVLFAGQRKYRVPLYPRGGTHWNALGSAIATQAVETALGAQRRDGQFKPFSFTLGVSAHPVEKDVDLILLMNLMFPPDHYDVPVVHMAQAPPPPVCKPLLVVVIGGSFMEHLGPPLSELPCGVRVVEYFYWSVYRITWVKGVENLDLTVSAALRDADLARADVIIYEENEELLGHSHHGAAYYEWVLAHPAAGLAKQARP